MDNTIEDYIWASETIRSKNLDLLLELQMLNASAVDFPAESEVWRRLAIAYMRVGATAFHVAIGLNQAELFKVPASIFNWVFKENKEGLKIDAGSIKAFLTPHRAIDAYMEADKGWKFNPETLAWDF